MILLMTRCNLVFRYVTPKGSKDIQFFKYILNTFKNYGYQNSLVKTIKIDESRFKIERL